MPFQWITLAIATSLALAGLTGWRVQRHKLDLWYLCAIVPFMVLAALELAAGYGVLDQGLYVPGTRLAYQAIILGVSIFLLVLLRGGQLRHRLVLAVQAFLGTSLAVVPPDILPGALSWGWQWTNITCSTALVGMLIQAMWGRLTLRGLPVLLVSIAAASVLFADLFDTGTGAVHLSWPQLFYTLILVVLWVSGSARSGIIGKPYDPFSRERKRLAQDIHDGVGFQLTTIISALDAGTPEQRDIALQLRECMVDLKMMIDGMGGEESVLARLASLRYRMQPLLRRLDVELVWAVADVDVLEGVSGHAANQILRIAQEALANVVWHSEAKTVWLTCCVTKVPQTLMLEIVDDGNGIPAKYCEHSFAATVTGGRGVPGMHARARALGGTLKIDRTSETGGSRLRLLVPLSSLAESRARHHA